MTMLRPQTGAIPAPQPGPISEPYWEGCRQRVLRFQRCRDCCGSTHTPALLCSRCAGSDLEWVDSSGVGEIYSWTTVWRPATPAFEVPYVPVIVTMDEDWWMLANLVGCEETEVAIGRRVEVEFHPIDSGIVLPYFHLID